MYIILQGSVNVLKDNNRYSCFNIKKTTGKKKDYVTETKKAIIKIEIDEKNNSKIIDKGLDPLERDKMKNLLMPPSNI